MRASLSKMYGQTLTVINRLDARDAALGADTYYTQVVNGMWSARVSRAFDSEGVATVSRTVTCQIADRDDYMPYAEWKAAENRDDYFTMRAGDYIVLGTIGEEVTASTLNSIIKSKGDGAMRVSAFRDLYDPSVTYARKDMAAVMGCLHMEGV